MKILKYIETWWYTNVGHSFLRAKKEDISKYKTQSIARKVTEINSLKIPTYPRVTIYDLGFDDSNGVLIFDSSDISVINNSLDLNNSFHGRTFLMGNEITFKNKKYLIGKVQIDFLDIFDDYSLNPFGTKHTSIYEGRDVPYSIQIIIEMKII